MTDVLIVLLDQVQTTMEGSDLWQSAPPSAEKMMSTAPFSIDTLSFLEWFQWIYVARLRAIIDADGQLPSGAQVCPYAVEAFKAEGLNHPELLRLIQEIDNRLV